MNDKESTLNRYKELVIQHHDLNKEAQFAQGEMQRINGEYKRVGTLIKAYGDVLVNEFDVDENALSDMGAAAVKSWLPHDSNQVPNL
jgi:hypothetical protein